MESQGKTYNVAKQYAEAGPIYMRFHTTVETKRNGHKKIGGSRPPYSKITEQPKYNKSSGDYYFLLMGREYPPGRWAILLDFDKKTEGPVKSGVEFAKILNMDQYGAPQTANALEGLPLHLLCGRRAKQQNDQHLH